MMSKNMLRVPRVITNPPVGLGAPFNFDRERPEEYSLVERKTLRAGRGQARVQVDGGEAGDRAEAGAHPDGLLWRDTMP